MAAVKFEGVSVLADTSIAPNAVIVPMEVGNKKVKVSLGLSVSLLWSKVEKQRSTFEAWPVEKRTGATVIWTFTPCWALTLESGNCEAPNANRQNSNMRRFADRRKVFCRNKLTSFDLLFVPW